MARSIIRITADRNLAPLVQTAGVGDETSVSLGAILRGLRSGSYSGTVETAIDEAGVQASGTVTCASVLNNDTVTVAGVVLTGKTGTPSGGAEWKAGVSNTADGAALAACINANTTTLKYVTASAASGVVTITALDKSYCGNLITLASSNGTRLAVSAATLANGAPSTFTTYTF